MSIGVARNLCWGGAEGAEIETLKASRREGYGHSSGVRGEVPAKYEFWCI